MMHVARYIKNVRKMSISMGPTEERGAALWVGYDLDGVDDDLSEFGLIKIDDDREGITFTCTTLEALGIPSRTSNPLPPKSPRR
jgi:hypothetical protein